MFYRKQDKELSEIHILRKQVEDLTKANTKLLKKQKKKSGKNFFDFKTTDFNFNVIVALVVSSCVGLIVALIGFAYTEHTTLSTKCEERGMEILSFDDLSCVDLQSGENGVFVNNFHYWQPGQPLEPLIEDSE